MTVCVAAICSDATGQYIVGASDQMVTAGDIEFEPPQSKIFAFTKSVVALIAGDTASQISICQNTLSDVNRTGLKTVRQIADAYGRQYALYRLAQSERELLHTLGLELASFVAQLSQSSPVLLSRLVSELRDYNLGSDTIVAGIDHSGAHLYVISNPGVVRCFDGLAFAVVGGGYWHAASQFMFAKYHRSWTPDRALLLAYSAKRRAEVAPGVGTGTGMVYINPHPEPFFTHITGDNVLIKKLEEIYKTTDAGHDAVNEESYKSMEAWIQSLIQEQQKQKQEQAKQEDKKKDIDK